jgi:DNA replication protein DnaC
MNQQTLEQLTGMRLPAMAVEYRRQLELGSMEALPFDERLALMVDAEYLSRHNKKLTRLLRAANLREPAACLEDLDYATVRKLDKSAVARLSDGKWVNEGKNLIITGATGTGKTYLSCAFANAVCRQGLKVKAYRVSRLLTDLAIGRGDGSYNKILNDLKKPDLLLLDDFGMTPVEAEACRDLMELVDERHGAKSIMITAQLPVAAWHDLFEDKTIADAVLDRLVNNAYRLQLSGPSMRNPAAKNE